MSRSYLPLLLALFLSACGSGSGNSDIDGDGVSNELDAFPQDAREHADSDGDGVGDNGDAFPNDESETTDSDGDEVGDNSDAFPNDNSETTDSDGDGVGDNSDEFPLDFDNDGVPDDMDRFPQDPTESADSDGDGIGNNSDPINDYIGLGSGWGETYLDGVALTGLYEGESLSAEGSTTVSVHMVDKSNDNSEYLGLVDVFFVSACTQLGRAEFTPAVVKASGVAISTYRDKGCGRAHGVTDNIVVYIGSVDDDGNISAHVSAVTRIEVEAKAVGTIEFVQAAPSVIALDGLGTAETPSISRVDFRVIDISGNPLPGYLVEFELDHEFGAAELLVSDAVTNEEGIAQVILRAGNVTGTVRVKASLDVLDGNGSFITSVTTLSTSIVMATSLASQQGFALSANIFNPHAWDQNNSEVVVTAHAGDSNQNPVLDGTRIYFRESAGLVNSSCEIVDGKCSVTWISANPKPVDGHVTILAHTRGQGDFQDANGNGLFDLGESFYTFGESWLDANGNGAYDATGHYQADLDIDDDGINDFYWNEEGYLVYVDLQGEYEEQGDFLESFIDSNDNDNFDPTPTPKYQGINCSEAAIFDGHCSELLDVADSIRIQMSAGNDVHIEGPFLKTEDGTYDYSQVVECVDGRTDSHQLAWRLADSSQRRNHVPMGTLINYSAENVLVVNESGTGEMPNTPPVATLSVWEVQPENADLSPEARKHKYLNERGSLIELLVTKPESDTGSTEFGTINLEVETLDGAIRSGPTTLKVDLLGNECPAS